MKGIRYKTLCHRCKEMRGDVQKSGAVELFNTWEEKNRDEREVRQF